MVCLVLVFSIVYLNQTVNTVACFDEAVVVGVVGEFRVLDEMKIADAEESGDGSVPFGPFTFVKRPDWCPRTDSSNGESKIDDDGEVVRPHAAASRD